MATIQIGRIRAEARVALSTRAAPQSVADALGITLGQPVPTLPGRSSRGRVDAMCLSPGRWLFLTNSAALAALVDTVEASLAGTVSHIADVSSGKAGFSVTGKYAAQFVSRFCPLDLDPEIFVAGHCAESLLTRIPVCVYRPADDPDLRLYVDRSFSSYAWSWLSDAANSA